MRKRRRGRRHDHRGFLVSEQHPELGGANGNGSITYPHYDARGHLLRKFDGTSYLKLEYDRAERLHLVRQSDSNWTNGSILRQLDFAEANDGGNLANGKLSEATANNLIGQTTFPVVETYRCQGTPRFPQLGGTQFPAPCLPGASLHWEER